MKTLIKNLNTKIFLENLINLLKKLKWNVRIIKTIIISCKIRIENSFKKLKILFKNMKFCSKVKNLILKLYWYWICFCLVKPQAPRVEPEKSTIKKGKLIKKSFIHQKLIDQKIIQNSEIFFLVFEKNWTFFHLYHIISMLKNFPIKN